MISSILHLSLISHISFAYSISQDVETLKSKEIIFAKRQSSYNSSSSNSVLQYVDSRIGTACGGHVMPGATLPFGMAKACPDVIGDNQGGFATDSNLIYGFSHMHDSGTGGSPSLGNFPIWAQSACPDDDLNNCKWRVYDRNMTFVNSTIKSSPGYFAIGDVRNILTEMTVSNHTALYRITFPADPPEGPLGPVILVDLLDLPNSRSNGSVTVDPTSGRIVGNGTFNPSFGVGTYDLHFCLDVTGGPMRDNGVWVYDRAGTEPKTWNVTPDGVNGNSAPVLPGGAWVRLGNVTSNDQVLVRVGVSFIGVDQACNNAQTEIPNFDFDGTVSAAEAAWEDKLGVIQVESGGVDEELLKVFYSGAYRAMLSPQDYTGENPLWTSSEPYYDSYYCGWDSFRAQHPMLAMVDPISQSGMVRSLVDIYRHEGWLPDCRMSLCKGFTQGGSNMDNVLVDSWLKGISGVDWSTAYQAMVTDAEDEPFVWSVEGRGGLTSWKDLGYIPLDDYDPYGVGAFTRSVSRTAEYSYNDFNIAQMAKGMGNQGDYEKYVQRSGNWKNVFNPDQPGTVNGTDTGFVGFMQPKNLNGTWNFQDPGACSPIDDFNGCYLNPTGQETYEGSPWLYTFFVPHDMASLITAVGGPTAFVNRLDYYHDSGIAYIGDEQAFLNVFLYHYAGRPGRSSYRAHFYIPSQFNSSTCGIPGNDDSGAMGAFPFLTMLGAFPNPGQNVYFILPPFFEAVTVMNSDTGANATIRNVNFDPSYQNIYIQSATLNGQPYAKNWIDHSFFLNGGLLELTLGVNESDWGTQPEDLPPSLSTGYAINGTSGSNGTAMLRW